MIRENQAIRANLRIDSRESGHLSRRVGGVQIRVGLELAKNLENAIRGCRSPCPSGGGGCKTSF